MSLSQVRNNVRFSKKTSKTVIPHNPVHRQKHGHDYGWEIQPGPNPDYWGVRVVLPCQFRSTNEIKSLFAMMPVSEAVVRRYFDFTGRYTDEETNAAILRMQNGKPKWFAVRLRELPDPVQGDTRDPFTLFVENAYKEFQHKHIRPMLRIEELMRLDA